MRRAPFPRRRPREPLPYRLVEKEVHGQLVRVKVYEPLTMDSDLDLLHPHPPVRAARERALEAARKRADQLSLADFNASLPKSY